MNGSMIVSVGPHSFDYSLFIFFFNNGMQAAVPWHDTLRSLLLRYPVQIFNVIGFNAIGAVCNICWLPPYSS